MPSGGTVATADGGDWPEMFVAITRTYQVCLASWPVVNVVVLPTVPDPVIFVNAGVVLHWIVYPVAPVTAPQVTVIRSPPPEAAAFALVRAGAAGSAGTVTVAVLV